MSIFTLWSSSSRLQEQEFSSAWCGPDDSWVVVRAGDTEPFSFGARARSRARPHASAAAPAPLHRLALRLDAWAPPQPVCVDRVGVFFRRITHTVRPLRRGPRRVRSRPSRRAILFAEDRGGSATGVRSVPGGVRSQVGYGAVGAADSEPPAGPRGDSRGPRAPRRLVRPSAPTLYRVTAFDKRSVAGFARGASVQSPVADIDGPVPVERASYGGGGCSGAKGLALACRAACRSLQRAHAQRLSLLPAPHRAPTLQALYPLLINCGYFQSPLPF